MRETSLFKIYFLLSFGPLAGNELNQTRIELDVRRAELVTIMMSSDILILSLCFSLAEFDHDSPPIIYLFGAGTKVYGSLESAWVWALYEYVVEKGKKGQQSSPTGSQTQVSRACSSKSID